MKGLGPGSNDTLLKSVVENLPKSLSCVEDHTGIELDLPLELFMNKGAVTEALVQISNHRVMN